MITHDFCPLDIPLDVIIRWYRESDGTDRCIYYRQYFMRRSSVVVDERFDFARSCYERDGAYLTQRKLTMGDQPVYDYLLQKPRPKQPVPAAIRAKQMARR